MPRALAVGCRYLAEMLRAADRADEAGRYEQLADDMYQRLDDIAWNGSFYQHHVSEDPSFVRKTGVDETQQMSLSLGYDTNRQIDGDKARSIIDSYQSLHNNLPAGSPGEFYNIYPPFEHGFDNKWHYMNGGVSTIVAGELAKGAFDHGREAYGYDILNACRAGQNAKVDIYRWRCVGLKHIRQRARSKKLISARM